MKIRAILPTPFRIALCFSLVALPFAVTPAAHAQEKVPVAVNLTAKKVIVKNGKETFESADKAKPGDIIQYEAVYGNSGAAAVQGLQATVPEPEGLTFVGGSATPAGAQASLDGKNFQPIPLMREVKKVDGTTLRQAVPLAEYRALRWSIESLDGGKSVAVQLRAEVRTNPSAK